MPWFGDPGPDAEPVAVVGADELDFVLSKPRSFSRRNRSLMRYRCSSGWMMTSSVRVSHSWEYRLGIVRPARPVRRRREQLGGGEVEQFAADPFARELDVVLPLPVASDGCSSRSRRRRRSPAGRQRRAGTACSKGSSPPRRSRPGGVGRGARRGRQGAGRSGAAGWGRSRARGTSSSTRGSRCRGRRPTGPLVAVSVDDDAQRLDCGDAHVGEPA